MHLKVEVLHELCGGPNFACIQAIESPPDVVCHTNFGMPHVDIGDDACISNAGVDLPWFCFEIIASNKGNNDP